MNAGIVTNHRTLDDYDGSWTRTTRLVGYELHPYADQISCISELVPGMSVIRIVLMVSSTLGLCRISGIDLNACKTEVRHGLSRPEEVAMPTIRLIAPHQFLLIQCDLRDTSSNPVCREEIMEKIDKVTAHLLLSFVR